MELNLLFRDGMVLAAGKPIRIFGTGKGHVRVEFLNMTAECDSEGGDWLIELDPQPYGGPYEIAIDLDGERTVLTDVWVGEVLLLHGQSNMKFMLEESSYPPECYENEDRLRLFSLEYPTEVCPFSRADGWIRCTAENAGKWSAIGYHVGLRLARELGCAVGMLAATQGASVIQSWLPEGTEERLGISLLPEQRHVDYSYPAYSAWNRDGLLYHFAIEPIMPYAFTQVLWYQGESNTTEAEGAVYDRLLTALIEQRRRDFDDEALSFVVVQIADYHKRNDEGWRAVQRAQVRVGERVAGVCTVISRDVCESNHIHPPTKTALCDRICEAILKKVKK